MIVHPHPALANAVGDIIDERLRQRERWHDDHLRTAGEWLAILVEEVGEVATAQKAGSPKDLRTELVQVAAVAIAMLEELDR